MHSSQESSRLTRLQQLREALVLERDAAKHLNYEQMTAATEVIASLLAELEHETTPLTAAEKEVVSAIQHESRRNAYFFADALEWVQESVQLVRGKNKATTAYTSGGGMAASAQEGRLVSGRI